MRRKEGSSCRICGSTERYFSGDCVACTRRRVLAQKDRLGHKDYVLRHQKAPKAIVAERAVVAQQKQNLSVMFPPLRVRDDLIDDSGKRETALALWNNGETTAQISECLGITLAETVVMAFRYDFPQRNKFTLL